MTLLIHLLMRLTTLFERGAVVEDTPDNLADLSEDLTGNYPKTE